MKRALVIVAVSAVVACSHQTTPASTPTSSLTTLRLFATHSTAPLVSELASGYNALYPDRLSNVFIGNHAALVQRLASGEAPYLFSTHLPDEGGLWTQPIAQDAIAIIVHPANPVTNLSPSQVRAIYQGIINNWQDLGGSDEPITVISRESGADIRLEFDRLVMGQRLTTSTAQLATSDKAVITQVTQDANAIGYISLGWLDRAQVSALSLDGVAVSAAAVTDNIYPLRSTVFIIGLAEPTEAYQDFFAWAQSAEGQAIIGQLYGQLP